jgi:adenosylcobinamide-GDP ribazoletransferase
MPVASTLRRESRAAATAVAFLTRLPVGRLAGHRGAELGRGAPAFPVVGTVLGLSVGGAADALNESLPPLTAGALALALGALLTGAMHLDALADTTDALGARSRERALEIMRDPRTGAYGATAIALFAVIEAGALGGGLHARPVAAAFGLARATAPAVACALPYARDAGPGLGRALAGGHRSRAVVGAALAVAFAIVLAPHDAAALSATSAACAAAAAAVCARRFGGVTGDTLGATIAVTEAACLVVAAAG